MIWPSSDDIHRSRAPGCDEGDGRDTRGSTTSLLVRMTNTARDAGVIVRRIHLVVAIDRLLARLLVAAPGQWVVKGGYANQLRRPDDARFTEDLDLRIDAAIGTAPQLLASGFAIDLADDFSYEVASSPAPLEGPPGGGLRFVVVARLAGIELVRFRSTSALPTSSLASSSLAFPIRSSSGWASGDLASRSIRSTSTLPRSSMPSRSRATSRTPGLEISWTLSGSSAASRSDRRLSRSRASRRSSAAGRMGGRP